jgi:hypothetical protein
MPTIHSPSGVCTLAVALNDAVHANLKVEAAQTPWERSYEWRVAISHFNEASLHLGRGLKDERVVEFIDSEPEMRAKLDEAMTRYEGVRAAANRIRNQAAFHYAYKSDQRAVARALGQLADHEGVVRGTKLRDSRMLFADEVVAQLLMNAQGGTDEAVEKLASDFADAVAAFARFAQFAVESHLLRHQAALHREPEE